MSKGSREAALEPLRKSAKRWLKAIRGGELAALAKLRQWLPRASAVPGLREVQRALVRKCGRPSWAAPKEHRETAALSPAELIDSYLRHACLSYGDDDWPHKWRRAERLRARHPELVGANLQTAAVSGELERVRELLGAQPELANARGGPQAWPPLLFVCYGRVQSAAAVEIARALLDAGADANAYFVMGDGGYRFTALTGAIGQGELGQPEHPQADGLVRLLLERGAHAADAQALYNTHLEGDDPRWLEMLSEHGLNAGAGVNWQTASAEPPKAFDYLLAQAAARGHVRRVRWLLSHGADPNARSAYTGKSSHQAASLAGQAEIAALLVESGARLEPLHGRDAFIAACARNDAVEARHLLAGHRKYLKFCQPLIDAAESGNLGMLELLLQMGMDANGQGVHGHRALHVASKNRQACEILLRYGADPRSRCFGGTVTGWARHGGDPAVARFHAEHSRSLLDAAVSGHVALARELLASDPSCVHERSPTGETPLHLVPEDRAAAESLIALLLAHGADRQARNQAGQTPAEALEARGLDEQAELLAAH